MDEVRLSKKQRTILEQLAKQQLDTDDPAKLEKVEKQVLEKLVQQRRKDQFELPELPTKLGGPSADVKEFFSEEEEIIV